MEQVLMWYMIGGIVTWFMGLYREFTKKSVGPADPVLVLALLLFWWIFLFILIFTKLRQYILKKTCSVNNRTRS